MKKSHGGNVSVKIESTGKVFTIKYETSDPIGQIRRSESLTKHKLRMHKLDIVSGEVSLRNKYRRQRAQADYWRLTFGRIILKDEEKDKETGEYVKTTFAFYGISGDVTIMAENVSASSVVVTANPSGYDSNNPQCIKLGRRHVTVVRKLVDQDMGKIEEYRYHKRKVFKRIMSVSTAIDNALKHTETTPKYKLGGDYNSLFIRQMSWHMQKYLLCGFDDCLEIVTDWGVLLPIINTRFQKNKMIVETAYASKRPVELRYLDPSLKRNKELMGRLMDIARDKEEKGHDTYVSKLKKWIEHVQEEEEEEEEERLKRPPYQVFVDFLFEDTTRSVHSYYGIYSDGLTRKAKELKALSRSTQIWNYVYSQPDAIASDANISEQKEYVLHRITAKNKTKFIDDDGFKELKSKKDSFFEKHIVYGIGKDIGSSIFGNVAVQNGGDNVKIKILTNLNVGKDNQKRVVSALLSPFARHHVMAKMEKGDVRADLLRYTGFVKAKDIGQSEILRFAPPCSNSLSDSFIGMRIHVKDILGRSVLVEADKDTKVHEIKQSVSK
ncbi:MAG: hypothetical protein ACTSUE_20370 [Promethearchaeota archaeon]